ncbi:hypothetical protein A2303_06185 [Candidatus Falkowbacteria bacterium RIFOXYB2_FULL_47_14]|uniref:Uncharacterized protein n=1 Tax=Candidatus Falkowbacteria bacterium RIFOXYA2_FULL_47_19 TaxID=1797994 RepID=A0A1F5SN69_9BACT|nr:MAG: hypothetical protein A2227_05210 [Candidatus Falkowbacteria bacterium RIFOXYA2_FULL_47_19]OGF35132.1 MAG: hypothetical protein A2468_04060 [Candidatus Falkowbacteria bacterium RIFOXYC2_FULL_46_15]OGF43150.1 MAG: hypothetical protein A2303_06185 [Candidatus Falkowbacteria bacterium RIFOXYB2_FULL_47_14]
MVEVNTDANPRVRGIARNTSYFTFALVIQKVISFAYFAVLARNLAPAELGQYYLAISFTTIFAIFVDLGLANILVRETAKDQRAAGRLIGCTLALKIPLALVTLAVIVFAAKILGYSALTAELVYLSSICMVLDSFTLTFFSALRGFHNLKYESIASVVFQVIVLVFGLSALKAGFGLKWIMSALVLASLFNFIYSFLLIKYKFALAIRPVFDRAALKPLLALAAPFALYVVFQRLYMYLDTVMLSKIAGDYHVGIYQIAFKVVFALQFLPMAFIASVYPAFSDYWKNNRGQLTITFERAMNYLIIISLPISLGIITLADRIILVFRPEYAAAVLPLQIAVAALFFIFLNFPIGALLNACDRQKINTRNMGLALAASVILNLFLIPKFHSAGAAATVLLTNFLMFFMGIIWVPKIIEARPRKIVSVFFKSLASAAIMVAFVWPAKAYLNIFIVVILAGAVYFGLLFLMKALRVEDIKSVARSFLR